MEFESTTYIDAPPARVWARLIDLERVSELVPWIESLELPDGPLQPGARVLLTVKALGRRERAEAKVVAADPLQRLALEADVPQAKAHAAVEWRLAPEGAGSRVTQRLALDFRSFMARIAASTLLGDALSAETAAKGLALLKEAVENEAPSRGADA